MDPPITRKTAQKLRIGQVLVAPYTVGSKEFDPSGIVMNGDIVSRVNVMGVVVDKKHGELVVDDASAQIVVRVFDQALLTKEVDIGVAVQVIGRIREFQGSRYIAPEAIACVNPAWLHVRQREVKPVVQEIKQESPMIQSQEVVSVEEPQKNKTATMLENIFNEIRINDSGNGVSVAFVIEKLGPDCESVIDRLLEQGEIFELSPGKVKVLE